ncbi:MAG: CoA transferase [Sphingomonadaceae bacterium]|nr:CoA transferase [Sphingomonadaceae bacterium]
MSALKGLRIVELAHERCALVGKLLADMGADVVLVEPVEGAAMRRYEPFVDDKPDPERSLHWWHYNTSKRGIALDWKSPEGRDALLKLIESADILVEAEDPGALAAASLGDDQLTGALSRLIHVSITPFGPDGPRHDEHTSDLTIMASGGVAIVCGYDDHELPPVRPTGGHGFAMGEHYAVMSVMTALIAREFDDGGQRIDVSLNAAANITTELASYTWLVAQQDVSRQTGRHAGTVLSMPSQHRCIDGRYVNTGVPPRTAKQYRAMLDWFRGLGFDKDFPETVFLEMGTQHPILELSKIGIDDEITAIFSAAREALAFACSRMTAYDFFQSAQKAGLPVGVIYSPDEAFEDEHFKARGMQVEVAQPQLGKDVRYVGAPYAFEKTPWSISRVAPSLGEHTDEVLSEIGINAESLRKRGAAA